MSSGRTSFLHLLDGDRAFIGAHGAQTIGVVTLAFEGKALGFAYIHAKELLVEALGHESASHRVDTAVGADTAETLSVEIDVDGDEEAVIGTDGMGVCGHEVGIHVHVCAYFGIHIDLGGLEGRHRDLDGVV